MNRIVTPYIVMLAVLSSFTAMGQRQVVLLSGEKILHRFLPGDYIYIKVKNDPVRYHTYINNILDDAFVLDDDTISFRSIERTYTGKKKFLSGLGKTLVQVGVGLFVIDQFNSVVVQHEKATLNRGITTVSLVCVAVGLPLMLIKKEGEPIGIKYKLYTIDPGSPFYR